MTGVAASDVLRIRENPSPETPIVGRIAPDAQGVEETGLSQDAGWAVVNGGEGPGFAAMRYLVRQAGPDWFTLQRPLTCTGAEPFWTLTFEPAEPVAVFAMPEGQAPFETTALWPGSDSHPTAAVALGDQKFATLWAEACSDGVSNRVFGIAASLFMLSGEGPVTLHGCCSVQR